MKERSDSKKEVLQEITNFTEKILKISPGSLDYQMLTDELMNFARALLVVFRTIDENDRSVTKALSSREKINKKAVISELDKCLKGENKQEILKHGEIIPCENANLKFEFSKEPEEVYVIAVPYKEEIIGEFFVVLDRKIDNECTELIKLYTRQVGLAVMRDKAEKELYESKKRLSAIITNVPEVIFRCRWDPYWTIEFISAPVKEITGYSPGDFIENKNLCYLDIIHPYDREKVIDHIKKGIEGKKSYSVRYRIIDRNKRIKWVQENGQGIYNERENLLYLYGIIKDITEEKKSERELQEKDNLLNSVFESIQDGVCVLDKNLNILYVNSTLNRWYAENYPLEGKKCYKVFRKKEMPCKGCPVLESFDTYRVEKKEVPGLADSEVSWLEVFAYPMIDSYTGEILGAAEFVRDVTSRKEFEKRLEYLSMRDQLTGVYNRQYFEEELEQLEKNKISPVTILVADVDGLKFINDTLGHTMGDELIKYCAYILKTSVPSATVLARMGGDEFAVLLPGVSEGYAHQIESKIHEEAKKINKENPEIPLSISTGFATFDNEKKDIEGSEGKLTEIYNEANNIMNRNKLLKEPSTKSQITKTLMVTLKERDYLTENHAMRLEKWCLKIGEKLQLNPSQLNNLALLARVHDLGKMSVPDSVLLKEGPLNKEEWEIMKKHSEKGYSIALASQDLAGVADLILKHHERWDGKGYPLGLKGEDIPIECRILAAVDAFDAMTSDRPYRKAMTKEEAVEELKRYRGTQFDPQVVDKFVKILEKYDW